MSSMRDSMPTTAAFIDALREAFGRDVIDRQVRAGLSGAPTFYAEENGHQLGTLATITPSANAHTFTERELADKGAGR